MKKILSILVIALLFFSCERDGKIRKYISIKQDSIKYGNHYKDLILTFKVGDHKTLYEKKYTKLRRKGIISNKRSFNYIIKDIDEVSHIKWSISPVFFNDTLYSIKLFAFLELWENGKTAISSYQATKDLLDLKYGRSKCYIDLEESYYLHGNIEIELSYTEAGEYGRKISIYYTDIKKENDIYHTKKKLQYDNDGNVYSEKYYEQLIQNKEIKVKKLINKSL